MFKQGFVAFCAVIGFAASTTSAFAMSGLGCPDLPEYYRAVGTVENGAYSCGMSMEEAKRILSQQRGPSDSPQYPTRYPSR